MLPGRTRFVAQVGILVAIAIVIRRVVTPQIPGLNLGGLPLIVSGLLLGPLGGFCVGAISDVVGYMVAPPGPFNPFYTLTAGLTGALPPLFLRVVPGPVFARVFVAVLLTQVLTKGVMIPLFNEWLLGIPALATATRNLAVQLLHAPLYAAVAMAILRPLHRLPGRES